MKNIKTMTMEWTGNSLILIDQRYLPLEEKYVECQTYLDVANSIKDMVVRGAPAIGATAAFGFVLGAKEFSYLSDKNLFLNKLEEVKSTLSKTRPTAVNLFWALNRMDKLLKDSIQNKETNQLVSILEEEALKIAYEDIEINILSKLFSINTKIGDLLSNQGAPIYYRFAGGRYFKIFTNYSTGSSAEKFLNFNIKFANSIGAILSSDLYFWYYQIFSDNHNLKLYDIKSFPIPIEKLTDDIINKLKDVYQRYLEDIERNVKVIDTDKYVNIDLFKRYEIRKSKSIIEEIDDIICPLYGLDDEEINFIKNYEIEFRVDDYNY
ncbi:MAG: Methylthioribose-1-phosphate isomerase 2 [Petrotoga mobilis]|nr:MAG: Methylthioribose-1-phosphate isomerase 2 [Petrotoga mobilis]